MAKTEEKTKEPWDFKKIIIAVLFVLVLLFGFLYVRQLYFPPKTEVKGESTEKFEKPTFSGSISQANDPQVKIQKSISEIQQNVESLNVKDVATSSPQVQKVLDDIKNLKDYPKNQARQACEQICQSL